MSDDFDFESLVGSPTEEGSELDAIFGDSTAFSTVENRDELPDDPFSLPNATYRLRIETYEIKAVRDKPTKFGLILNYKVADGPYANYFAGGEWLHYWHAGEEGTTDADRIKALSNLNLHLKAFGLSPEEIDRFSHRTYRQLLNGREFVATTRIEVDPKSGRKNVRVSEHKSVEDFFAGNSNDGTGMDWDV